nr:unnamed protein product [Spirometra erinaceieuropaei]
MCPGTPSDHLSPRESAKFITEHADHVKINNDAIQPLAQKFYDDLKAGTFGSSWADIAMHPKTMDVSTVRWIFLVDSLNFSFWTEGVKYVVSFRGEAHTGYMALCAAVNRALEEGIDLLDANVLASLTLEKTKHIFRSDTSAEIPLLETRHKIMLSHAETLLKKYNGCFSNCLTSCNGSAADLLALVTRDFPSFDDRAVFKGQPVTLWKRAQILVADLWLAFKGQSFGHFKDIDSLTAFADYRVPQVLAYFGVLEYDSELRQRLDKPSHLRNEASSCSFWGYGHHHYMQLNSRRQLPLALSTPICEGGGTANAHASHPLHILLKRSRVQAEISNCIAAAQVKREARKSQLRPLRNANAQPLPTCPRCQRKFRARIGLIGHLRINCTSRPAPTVVPPPASFSSPPPPTNSNYSFEPPLPSFSSSSSSSSTAPTITALAAVAHINTTHIPTEQQTYPYNLRLRRHLSPNADLWLNFTQLRITTSLILEA